MSRRLLFLFCALGLVGVAPVRAVTVEQVAQLEVDPHVTQPLGVDRASKYLLTSVSDNGGEQLAPPLALSILEELMVLPEFQGSIGLALSEGDYRLARTMRQVLLSMNMSQQAAETLLLKMASSGGQLNPDVTQVMQDASHQKICQKAFYQYMIDTPEDYPSLIAGVSQFWAQPQARVTRLFRERFETVLTPAEWTQIMEGDIPTRWKLNELIEVEMLRPNIFTDMLRSHSEESLQTPYPLFWSRWMAQVAAQPLLLQEMVTRLHQSTTVYDKLQSTVAKALQLPEAGDALLKDYVQASRIPQSRYQRVFQLLSDHPERPVEMDDTPRSKMIARWSQKIDSDRIWCNYLLWHLTRPASSLAQITLHAVGEQMAGMQDIAQIAYGEVEDQNQPHPDWVSQAVPDPREFRRLKGIGRLTASDWLIFGNGMARILQQDPEAAQWLFFQSSRSSFFFVKAMTAAMQSSSQMVTAWADTMLRSNALLQQQFLGWVMRNGVIHNAAEGQQWLAYVAAHAAEVGDPQVGQFKDLWKAWIDNPRGQETVLQALSLEIWGVNRDVRQLLVAGWSADIDGYLAWRHMATFLPPEKGGIIARDSVILLRQGNFMQACLQGAMRGNLAIGDAMVPVWRAMFLRPEGELVAAFQNELTRGALMGNPYSAGALALADAIEKVPGPVDESLARVNLTGYAPGEAGRAKLSKNLLEAGMEVRPVVVDLMRNKEIWTTWRNSLFSAILFAGKGTAAADLVARDDDLKKIWSHELEKEFATDLDTVSYIMSGLAKQSTSDQVAADALAAWRSSLMNADAANQAFFEQMIADPSGGYRAQFDALCAKYFTP